MWNYIEMDITTFADVDAVLPVRWWWQWPSGCGAVTAAAALVSAQTQSGSVCLGSESNGWRLLILCSIFSVDGFSHFPCVLLFADGFFCMWFYICFATVCPDLDGICFLLVVRIRYFAIQWIWTNLIFSWSSQKKNLKDFLRLLYLVLSARWYCKIMQCMIPNSTSMQMNIKVLSLFPVSRRACFSVKYTLSTSTL